MIISFDNGQFSLTRFMTSLLFLSVLSITVVIFKVERKNAQRVKTDKTGTFDSINTLKFYDDRIVMENEALKSTAELKYDQFFAVMESKDYFIFYFTVNQASLVRKKDIDNANAFKEFIVDKFKGKYKNI
ncbi:MAG: YcxB family protein [Clostridiaceae bacterium]|nr:YcxB family protein [Clostridiaceae bacterium]